MAKFDPPQKFSFKPSEWSEWIEDFNRFRKATKLHLEEGDVQRDSLIYCMDSRQAGKIFATFRFNTIEQPDPDDPTKTVQVQEKDTDYDCLVRKFTEYFIPKRNIIHERIMFQERAQRKGETVEEFLRELQSLVKTCDYGDPEDQVRDRFVAGLCDRTVKQKLQLNADLTLNKAVIMARQHEQVAEQLAQQLAQTQMGPGVNEARVRRRSKPQQKPFSPAPSASAKTSSKCSRCGYETHKSGRCPASGKTCVKCKKIGHFASECHSFGGQSRTRKHQSSRPRQTNEISAQRETEEYFLGEVDCATSNSAFIDNVDYKDIDLDPWIVQLPMCGSVLDFKIDTGADISVISHSAWQALKVKPELQSPSVNLDSPGGKLHVHGIFVAKTRHRGTNYSFRVAVIDGEGSTGLLARAVSAGMGLVQRVDTIGLVKTEPVQIKLKEGVNPLCVTSARRVPFPLQEPVKQELERMQKEGVIREVTEPTEWCAPMVPVRKKDGNVRICVDLKQLNKAVCREHFQLPALEDIAPKLSESKYFSKLDAASGFWQIPLESDSQLLTTFMTPHGRFAFKRVPFGISSAPEIFQRKMTKLLEGLDGVEVIMDDILVHGRTIEEHDERLRKCIQRINEVGLRLNWKKCQFRMTSLTYFGCVVSNEGIKPDPDKVSAIQDLEPPTSQTELRSILGMFHYLGKFVNLADKLKPLTELLQADRAWTWGPSQDIAFQEAKKLVCTAPTLAYYDQNKPTTVSADASSFGLGGVLLQLHKDGMKPVAFCSRTLTSSEQNYSQIEKECLAAVWSCEKFAKYLVGLSDFTLLTDHKPLVPLLMRKGIDESPLRCQRLLMRMMRFCPTVQYVPGKDQVVADALSRKPLPLSTDDVELSDEVTAYVDTVRFGWPATPSKLAQIKHATEQDDVLALVSNFVIEGWPRREDSVPTSLRPYYDVRSELSVTDGILVYQDRIVIPASMRADILGRIHETHQGIDKCKERARMSVWWPHITREIKSLVENCKECRESRPTQREQPLQPIELPQRPWSIIGTDLLQYKKSTYMVVVDYYSRWICVETLSDTTSSEAVITKLKGLFATYGIPDTVVSDNGPQYKSETFANFASSWGFSHITTNPYHPQENGMAERAVQEAKKILSQKDPEIALLNYRATPHTATKVSPAKALLGRELKTRVPVLPRQLLSKPCADGRIRESDRDAKQKYKFYYDKRHGARELTDLVPGDDVLTKLDHEKGWSKPAKVIQSDGYNRSYVLQSSDSPRLYRRNRKHIQQMPVPQETTVADKDPPPIGQSLPSAESHGGNTKNTVSDKDTIPDIDSKPKSPEKRTVVYTRSGRMIKPPSKYSDE